MNRKEFIKQTGIMTLGLATASSLGGCSLFDEAEMLLCPETDMEEGTYKTFVFNRKKLLLRRTVGKIEVISLVCTHKRCTVVYQEEEKMFVCPCHEGTYNFDGQVIDGPPPAPLRRLDFEVREGMIWVLK